MHGRARIAVVAFAFGLANVAGSSASIGAFFSSSSPSAHAAPFPAPDAESTAEPLSVACGQTVTGTPGQQINTPIGPRLLPDPAVSPLDKLLSDLLGSDCTITVRLVGSTTLSAQVWHLPIRSLPILGEVSSETSNSVDKPAVNEPPANSQPIAKPASEPESSTAKPSNSAAKPIDSVTPAESPPALNTANQTASNATFDPLEATYPVAPAYNTFPATTNSDLVPSPGLRYDGPPHAHPETGDSASTPTTSTGAHRTGEAWALPSRTAAAVDRISLPVLLTVLVLSGLAAALVRMRVFRKLSLFRGKSR